MRKIFLVFLLIFPIFAAAQSRPTTTRVAVINFRLAVASTDEGRQASAELQKRFASRLQEVQDLDKQLRDVVDVLNKGQGKISPLEIQRLRAEASDLNKKLQRKRADLSADIQDADDEAFNRVAQKMADVVAKYAREHGYDVVLDTSAGVNAVLYASDAVDITQEVVKLYNQNNSVDNEKKQEGNPK